MRVVWWLSRCKFPLWHTWNRHEHKVHCLRFILSIYHFSIQSKAIEIKPFEVWVRNGKKGLFLHFAKRKIYTSLRKYDSKRMYWFWVKFNWQWFWRIGQMMTWLSQSLCFKNLNKFSLWLWMRYTQKVTIILKDRPHDA